MYCTHQSPPPKKEHMFKFKVTSTISTGGISHIFIIKMKQIQKNTCYPILYIPIWIHTKCLIWDIPIYHFLHPWGLHGRVSAVLSKRGAGTSESIGACFRGWGGDFVGWNGGIAWWDLGVDLMVCWCFLMVISLWFNGAFAHSTWM